MGYEPGEVMILSGGLQLQVMARKNIQDQEYILARKILENEVFAYEVTKENKEIFFEQLDENSRRTIKILKELKRELESSHINRSNEFDLKLQDKISYLTRTIPEEESEKSDLRKLLEKYSDKKRKVAQESKEKRALDGAVRKNNDGTKEIKHVEADKTISQKSNEQQVVEPRREVITSPQKIPASENKSNKKEKNDVLIDDPRTDENYYELILNNGSWERKRPSDPIEVGFINCMFEGRDEANKSDINSYTGKCYVIATKHGNHFRDIVLEEKVEIDQSGINQLLQRGTWELNMESIKNSIRGKLTCSSYREISFQKVKDFLQAIKHHPMMLEKYKTEIEAAKKETVVHKMYNDKKNKREEELQELNNIKDDIGDLLQQIRVKK